MRFVAALAALGLAATAIIMTSQTTEPARAASASPIEEAIPTDPAKRADLVVAGGCFWCLETLYDQVKGVYACESGYAGGEPAKPTYEQVSGGHTGHAEVVKITYNPSQISAKTLLEIFFTMHDPTTKNRQGNDVGTQYRSAIFYANDDQKKLAEQVIQEITKAKIWPNPIVTTLEPLRNYSRAEEYHQDYFDKFERGSVTDRMRMNGGYCSAIISPKVTKFRQKFAHLIGKG